MKGTIARRRPRTASIRIPVVAFWVALLLGGAASAQGIDYGVKGGVNVATVTSEEPDGSATLDWRVRGVVGGFVTLPLSSQFELQPEALYSQKGAGFEDSGIDVRLLLDYIDVPVLGRFSWRTSGGTRFYVAGGPSFGIRVRARTTAAFSGATEEIDIDEDVERFDIGAVVAAGLEMGSVVIDGRYTHGLSDIDRDSSDEVKMFNRVVSITAGFRF